MTEFHRLMPLDLPGYPGTDREGWLTYFDHSFPYEHPEHLDELMEALDKAGLCAP